MSDNVRKIQNIEKENTLRLKWFKENEPRLQQMANKANSRTVPKEVRDAMKEKIVDSFQNVKRNATPPFSEEPPKVDEEAMYNIMRPVDKETTKLIYSSPINEGRINYLKERMKILPELRYYFPETTSFQYGWNMWEDAKNAPTSPFARQQVIKNSFYRRRAGIERDPEWYKEPARLSPSVCGCI